MVQLRTYTLKDLPMSMLTIIIAVTALIMFGGAIRLLLTKVVNATIPLASSLEVYAKGIERKTELNVNRDIARLEYEVKQDLQAINKERASVELAPSEFEL